MSWKPEQTLTIRQPLSEFIDSVQPRTHLSCDDVRDPMKLGLQIFPLRTYQILEKLNHGNSSR